MKSVSGKELAKAVELRGWRLLRIAGSHHIYGRPEPPCAFRFPFTGHRPLKLGLQSHIMKLAGLSEADL